MKLGLLSARDRQRELEPARQVGRLKHALLVVFWSAFLITAASSLATAIGIALWGAAWLVGLT
jgi:hypothetical protein